MSEKCWECRVKVLPLFGVSDSHTFQFSSFGTGNWEWFPAQSSKFSFMSGNSQSPWEALVLLQDGREGFKLHFLKGCLAWTSCATPESEQSWSGQDRQTDRQTPPPSWRKGKPSCPPCWAPVCSSFSSVHNQPRLGVWHQLLQGSGTVVWQTGEPWADEAPPHCAALGGQHFLTGQSNACRL